MAARRIFEDAEMDVVPDTAKVALFVVQTNDRRIGVADRRRFAAKGGLICGKCIAQMPPETYRVVAA